jgi:hypothetical protein
MAASGASQPEAENFGAIIGMNIKRNIEKHSANGEKETQITGE